MRRVARLTGEEPMPGRAFTYTIEVLPSADRFGYIRLVNVTRDE